MPYRFQYKGPRCLGLDSCSLAWPDPFSRRALSIRDDKRLSSLIDKALREKGSGHARLGQLMLQVRRIHNKNEYTLEYTHLKRRILF